MSRLETDSFGTIAVAVDRLWGAQTQRSLEYFAISTERMPEELIRSLAEVKVAGAQVNRELGLLPEDKALAIMAAADEVATGTQTNMNLNEVLANRASELLGGKRASARLVHPNDEVNLGQSSSIEIPKLHNSVSSLSRIYLCGSNASPGIVSVNRATHVTSPG